MPHEDARQPDLRPLPAPLADVLRAVNVPSADDGRRFTRPDRRRAIARLLDSSPWRPLHHGRLADVYAHGRLRATDRLLLLSCHIDSLYRKHFARRLSRRELVGTFDNAICNAVLVDLMLRDRLPPNALVAFTGDEEQDSRGAAETIRFLRRSPRELWPRLELVIVLDVTSVAYARRSFTIENAFVRSQPHPGGRLHVPDARALVRRARAALGSRVTYVPAADADPDETWEYDEHDLNCLLLAIPTAPAPGVGHGNWMHDRRGIRVRTASVPRYAAALERLCKGFAAAVIK
jgi:hypothetical protein